jgi:D-alanyl-D-alanine carboxypeptidase
MLLRRFSSLVVLWLVLASLAIAAPSVYQGAIVVDADSGEVVFEDNADYVGPPASMTKLMSFLVIKDQLKTGRLTPQTPVTTSADASRIGGTQVWLKQGEIFDVEELLMAMMIKSANDAAHALAEASLGSREAFVAAMNARARQLGMTHSTWRTPHGLPASSRRLEDGDMTSPRDMAMLARVLLRETDITRYTSIPLAHFGQGKRAEPVLMDNHNNLVGKMQGVDGLKTGYTKAAGFCLTATAERNGRRIVGVIMGSATAKERDAKMRELLEAAFAKLGPGQPKTIPTISPKRPDGPKREDGAPVISPVPMEPAPKAPEDPAIQFQVPKSIPKKKS